ncbi:MAG: hypothetical protein K8S99_04750 [Planctomycetes bacterium]|nr:hypothetical protein [Planctomycetota bacterium]
MPLPLTIGVYTQSLVHFHEALTYLMSRTPGWRCFVITQTDLSKSPRGSEHPMSFARIKKLGYADLIPLDYRAMPLDWLIIDQQNIRPTRTPDLDRWCGTAGKICCMTDWHRYVSLRCVARDLVRGYPYYLKACRMIFQTAQGTWSPYVTVRRKIYFSPMPHPQFMLVPEGRERMYSPMPDPEDDRAYALGFVGSRLPPEREVVMRQAQAEIGRHPDLQIIDEPDAPVAPGKRPVFWSEYGDNDVKRGVGKEAYVPVLDRMEFCISPLGYGGLWTHRVVEAVMRGAIPITQDEKRYNIGLADMETCISADKGGWEDAVRRALAMPREERVRMRRNLAETRRRYLEIDAAAARLRKQLAFD